MLAYIPYMDPMGIWYIVDFREAQDAGQSVPAQLCLCIRPARQEKTKGLSRVRRVSMVHFSREGG